MKKMVYAKAREYIKLKLDYRPFMRVGSIAGDIEGLEEIDSLCLDIDNQT